jgi:hypothetical protein
MSWHQAGEPILWATSPGAKTDFGENALARGDRLSGSTPWIYRVRRTHSTLPVGAPVVRTVPALAALLKQKLRRVPILL